MLDDGGLGVHAQGAPQWNFGEDGVVRGGDVLGCGLIPGVYRSEGSSGERSDPYRQGEDPDESEQPATGHSGPLGFDLAGWSGDYCGHGVLLMNTASKTDNLSVAKPGQRG